MLTSIGLIGATHRPPDQATTPAIAAKSRRYKPDRRGTTPTTLVRWRNSRRAADWGDAHPLPDRWVRSSARRRLLGDGRVLIAGTDAAW